MKCPRCKTTTKKYFQEINGRYYCRRCIGFGRVFVDEELNVAPISKNNKHVFYQLAYELTKNQKIISDKLVNNVVNNKNSMVLAVCGSGKTEIVYDSMVYILNQGKRVCFAVPRKSLVIELGERIKKQFHGVNPSLFYGGHKDELNASLVVCTTHQLYRFHDCFDLIILDEIDAFPYHNNQLLEDLLFASMKGTYIFMSATLDVKKNDNVDLFVLNRRYHLVDLPIPVYRSSRFKNANVIIKEYLRLWSKPVLIYVPRIIDLDKYDWLSTTYKVEKVSSKTKNTELIIEKLKSHEIDIIITTTLLERGITIENVQVIVVEASHVVYTTEVLIQIAGRVGRSPKYPVGEVIFLSKQKSKAIIESINKIIELNQMSV